MLATTSSLEVLDALQLRDSFTHSFEIPSLTCSEFLSLLRRESFSFSHTQLQTLQTAYPTQGVPIKRLLGVIDTAKYSSTTIDALDIIRKSFQ